MLKSDNVEKFIRTLLFLIYRGRQRGSKIVGTFCFIERLKGGLYDGCFSSPPRDDYNVRVLLVTGRYSRSIFRTSGSPHTQGEETPKYFLSQNYPNPFNLTTTISYSLQTGSRITLKIYDMLDRGVATLAIGTQSEGNYIVTFDGSKLASGVYLYRLDALGMNGEQFTDTKRMVLIK